MLKERCEKWVQENIFLNEKVAPLVDAFYYRDDGGCKHIELSSEERRVLNSLRRDGIAKMPNLFEAEATILDEYFNKLESQEQPDFYFKYLDESKKDRRLMMNTKVAHITYLDERLTSLYCNKSLLSIVYHYYGKQPYYRNQPMLFHNKRVASIPNPLPIEAKYHIDYHMQTILVLLVNDVSIDDTHTEYALGSTHTKNTPWNRYLIDDNSVLNEYEIGHAIGKKGTLYIIDTGRGIHRANYKPGTERKSLFLTFTGGHYISKKHEDILSSHILNNKPDYIKNAFRKVSRV